NDGANDIGKLIPFGFEQANDAQLGHVGFGERAPQRDTSEQALRIRHGGHDDPPALLELVTVLAALGQLFVMLVVNADGEPVKRGGQLIRAASTTERGQCAGIGMFEPRPELVDDTTSCRQLRLLFRYGFGFGHGESPSVGASSSEVADWGGNASRN